MIYSRNTRSDATSSPDPELQPGPDNYPERVIVLGAGLAGCSTAYALARRGIAVTLIDAGPGPASAASGNPQGMLYCKLPAVPTPESQIHLSGYLYSLELIRPLLADQPLAMDLCGQLQLASNPAEQQRQQRLLDAGHYPESLLRPVTAQQASELAGVAIEHPGLFFPDAGWVSPPALCRTLLESPLIETVYNCRVTSIVRSAEGNWTLRDAEGHTQACASVLVAATGSESAQLALLAPYGLQRIRGQITLCARPVESSPLRTVLCGKGYIAPARQERYCFGASFNLHSQDPRVNEQDQIDNLQRVDELSPTLAGRLSAQLAAAQGRVSFRSTSRDYLPLIGALPDQEGARLHFAPLRRNAKACIPGQPPREPGLYISLAHGSKGLTTAPLGGEILAALICAEPAPLPDALLARLDPVRFIIKDQIRGNVP